MKPTRILEIGKRLKGRYTTKTYKCDNGHTYNRDELALAAGLSPSTIKKRIERCDVGEIYSPDILRVVGDPRTYDKSSNNHSTNWDRNNCKRKGVKCEHYTECQNQRIGMRGAGKWIPPEDTDECYENSD